MVSKKADEYFSYPSIEKKSPSKGNLLQRPENFSPLHERAATIRHRPTAELAAAVQALSVLMRMRNVQKSARLKLFKNFLQRVAGRAFVVGALRFLHFLSRFLNLQKSYANWSFFFHHFCSFFSILFDFLSRYRRLANAKKTSYTKEVENSPGCIMRHLVQCFFLCLSSFFFISHNTNKHPLFMSIKFYS